MPSTRSKVRQAFVDHGPILTTSQVVKYTGLYTTAARHYLKEPEYKKIGTTGERGNLSVWERVVEKVKLFVNSIDGLNLREDPGGNVIRTLPNNATLVLIDDFDGIGDWLHVSTDIDHGFVHRNFVSKTQAEDKYRSIIAELAKTYRVEERQVRAVIAVESGGSGLRNGRVVARFEPHVFASQLGDVGRVRQFFTWNQDYQWKDHKFHGKDFHTSQDQEYEALLFCATFGGDAAYQSASYGAGQLMGFHYKKLGYASAKEMLERFADENEQIRAMFGFMEFSGALDRLRDGDYVGFATIYNGSGQAESYAKLIQQKL